MLTPCAAPAFIWFYIFPVYESQTSTRFWWSAYSANRRNNIYRQHLFSNLQWLSEALSVSTDNANITDVYWVYIFTKFAILG